MLDPGRPLPVCEAQLRVKEQTVTGKQSETRSSFLGVVVYPQNHVNQALGTQLEIFQLQSLYVCLRT